MKRDRVIHDKQQEDTADYIMDNIQAADGANTAHKARSQIEDEDRQEKQFMSQFAYALNNQLLPAGIMCVGVLPDGEGHGYRVFCRDSVGRRYDVDLGFEEWLSTVERIGGDAGREMLDVVAKRILEARAAYFRRMT